MIVAVADAYEAMTSDRTYRRSLGHDAARDELRRGAGTQFDPQVVCALVSAFGRHRGMIESGGEDADRGRPPRIPAGPNGQ